MWFCCNSTWKCLAVIPAAFLGVYLLSYIFLTVALMVYRLILKILDYKIPNNSNTKRTTRHVLVTGGSQGIGLELAKLYVQQGKDVTIMARDPKKLDAAMKILEGLTNGKGRVQAVSCDVASSEEIVSKAISKAVKSFGDVDLLINVAGTSVSGEFESIPIEDFERMMRVNVLGSVLPTRCLVPAMKSRQFGHIVFVSSQVAQAAIYGFTAYAPSKWALRGLAEALQMELKPFGVSVSVAYPPDTDTPGYQEEMKTKPALTHAISQTSSLLTADTVAKDIAFGIEKKHYNIHSGFDGWMLKQLHPGMSPVNSVNEVAQQVAFSSVLRLVSSVYLLFWDFLVMQYLSKELTGKGKEKEKVKVNSKESKKSK